MLQGWAGHTHTRARRVRTPRGALAHRRALSSRQTFLDALQRPLPVTFRYTDLASAAYRREGERHLEAWAARGAPASSTASTRTRRACCCWQGTALWRGI